MVANQSRRGWNTATSSMAQITAIGLSSLDFLTTTCFSPKWAEDGAVWLLL